MQAFVPSERPAAQQYTGQAVALCPKFCAKVAQNAHMPSGRAKKRERDEKNLDSNKCERFDKSIKKSAVRETVWKLKLSNLVGNDGGLCNLACVDKLICLMQHARNDGVKKQTDVLLERTVFVNIILATQQADCLNKFVKLRGLPLLDEWLQDALRGKSGDNESPMDGERVSEDLVLILLRTLESLPVDLVALHSCSVGKSVNCLRNYRNVEIQKRARKLIDMWEERVESEMKQSGELNVVLNRGMRLPARQHPIEHNFSLPLKEDKVLDVALRGAVHVKSVPQMSNSTEFVGQGESPCTGVEMFASVSLLCSPAVCNNQSKSPTTSLPDKSRCKPSQTTDLESSWFEPTVKSTGRRLCDCDGDEENVEGCGSCVRDWKFSAGASESGSIEKDAILRCRNVALERAGQNVYGSDIGTSMRAQNDNLNNLTSSGVVSRLGQNSLHAICGSSCTSETHTPSSGSLSPSTSDNHAHVDSDDRTDARNTDVGLAASSSKRNIEESCRASPSLKPIDTGEIEAKCEGDVIDDWKSRKCLPATGRAVGSNKNELKKVDVLTASSAFSNMIFPGKINSTSDIATAGINLLASVAASECSIVEKKVHASELEKSSSTYGPALMQTENSSNQQGKTLASRKGTIQRGIGRLFTDREQFDRISSTVSSPSNAETKPDTFTREGLCQSNGCLSAEAPTAIDTASSDERTSDSFELTANLLKPSSGDPSRKLSLKCFSIDHAVCEELCRLQPASKKEDKQFTATCALIAEAMGESSVSGLIEPDALKEREDGKVLDTERALSAMSSLKESNSISRIFGDHAREADGQVSMEVEQHERVKSAGNTSDTEKLDRSQNCGSFTMELPPKVLRAEYGEMEETDVATFFQPKTVEWNLNYTLDEKAEWTKPRTLDQAKAALGRSVVDGGDAVLNDANQKPVACGCDPSSLHTCFHSILTKDEAAVQTIALSQQELQQVSCTIRKANANTWEQSMMFSGPESDGIKRNDRLRRLEFDLNEGFSCEEGSLQDSVSPPLPYAKQSAVLSGPGPTVPIVIVAAMKGPFILPANPFRLTGELGWKGSAATSAFRPAQPRQNAEKHSRTAQSKVAENSLDVKVVKPLLRFDLNVAADKGCEDAGTVSTADIPLIPLLQDTCFASSHQPLSAHSVIGEAGSWVSDTSRNERVVRPIWDLNCANMDDDGEAILASQVRSMECLLSCKDSKSTILDFDLNDGPVSQDLNELVQSAGCGNHFKIPEPSACETRVMTGAANEGSAAFGRKAVLSENSESPFSLGSAQSLVCTGTEDGSFHRDIYRNGHAFRSSGVMCPAPPSTDYSFTGFPFGFSPASFCTLSAPFVNPSEAQPFPVLPPALLRSETVFSSKKRPPYLMDVILPTGDTSWGRPSLDLNSGPELGDADAKDDRSSSRQLSAIGAFGAHRRVMHQSIDTVDHLKKKEMDGWWGMQRAVVEQPLWH